MRREWVARGRAFVLRNTPSLRRAAVVLTATAIVALSGGIGFWLADLPPAPAKRTQSVFVSLPIVAVTAPRPEPDQEPQTLTPPPGGPALGDEPAPPAWRRFAVAAPDARDGAPMIAVVVDDMGVALARSWRTIELRGPLTLAYLPYAQDLAKQTEAARRAGHELVVHLPMEPDDADEDPGPNALLIGLDDDEIHRRLEWNLGRFGAYVGVSNHMGSRFTRDAEAMEVVLAEIKARGLLFLDSRTTPDTVALRVARRAGVPATRRDVFIDNAADGEAIAAQLSALEALARERGYAVGIAHPRPETLKALATWLPGLEDRGFALVPISAIVERVNASGPTAAEAPGAGAD